MSRMIPALAFLIILNGCSGSEYVKSDFDYKQTTPHKIALVPVLQNLPVSTDSSYATVLRNRDLDSEFLSPSRIRSLTDSLNARELIEAVLGLEPKSGERSKSRSLINHLDSSQMDHFREVCRGADLVFVPSQFSLKKSGGAVIGKVTHRLYDLQSGDLLYEKKESVNVMPGGILRTGGLISALGAGSDISESNRPEASYATTILAVNGINNLRDKILVGE